MTNRFAVMNNTKWEELRVAMLALDPSPVWRCRTVDGHYSDADREWFYHFRDGGYDDLLYVDILPDDERQREHIRDALKSIHLPGEETEAGFRVFGYAESGQTLSYL